jgi:hypothetical protein
MKPAGSEVVSSRYIGPPDSRPSSIMKFNQRIIIVALATAFIVPCTVFAAKSDKKREKAPAATFASCDKNKDGVVTKDEYHAAMVGSLGADGANKMFATLDKNGDGKLSKEEFGGGRAKGESKGKGVDKKKKNRNS